jgi:hypothetical protein
LIAENIIECDNTFSIIRGESKGYRLSTAHHFRDLLDFRVKCKKLTKAIKSQRQKGANQFKFKAKPIAHLVYWLTTNDLRMDIPSALEQLEEYKKSYFGNSFTKQYKTRVTELYKNSEVNFSGKYTVIYWDAGMGTTLGTLIDCSNGIAYDIPINDETAFIGCFDENKLKIFESIFASQKVFFTKESNLLVLRSCDEYNNDGIIFRFYIWNEDIKKFTLLKIEKNVF